MTIEPRCAGLLRRLALNDDAAIGSILGVEAQGPEGSDLDDKTRALVRLAALIATECAPPSYQRAVSVAFAAGVREEEVTGALTSVADIVGVARIVSAAPALASALGYDLDFAQPG